MVVRMSEYMSKKVLKVGEYEHGNENIVLIQSLNFLPVFTFIILLDYNNSVLMIFFQLVCFFIFKHSLKITFVIHA